MIEIYLYIVYYTLYNKKGLIMSFNLQMGFTGTKEKYIATRYIESNYKELEDNTNLWVELRHQNGVRGQFFDKIEDLLRDDESITSYENFDDYVKQDCGSQGYIDSLIMDNIDENKDNKDFSFEELKEIVRKYEDSDIIESFDSLKEDEKLYVLNDCNGEYISTNKDSLVLDNIADGQYQRIYSNVEDIIEAINSDEELATVFIYNYMGSREQEEYRDEFNQLKEHEEIFSNINKLNENDYINLDTGSIVDKNEAIENNEKKIPDTVLAKKELLNKIDDINSSEKRDFYFEKYHYLVNLICEIKNKRE